MNLLIKPKVILIIENDSAFDILLNFKFLNNFKIIPLDGIPPWREKLKEGANVFDAEIILVEKSQAEQIKNIPADFIKDAFLVFNYDNEPLRKICQNIDIKKISFGFSEEADFKVSDVNELENNTNFKINYRGNTVPVWLKKFSGKNPSTELRASEIYNFLSAICIGDLLGLNIIEISDSFKL